eukprot:Skav217570  [mRNA]  locus=scaffold1602:806478:810958:+ [translate_table: standard]
MNRKTCVSRLPDSKRRTTGDRSVGFTPPTYQQIDRPPLEKALSKLPPMALTHRKMAFCHSTQPAYLLKRGGANGVAFASVPLR